MKTCLFLLALLVCPQDKAELVPLTEMTEKYKGEDGGLYGGGKNEPPEAHAAAAKKEIEQIKPLGADGKPADDGKIVLLSIGMSNTTQEFSRFKQLAEREKSKKVVIVDGAQGGQAALQWAGADKKPWSVVEERIKAAGVTGAQVQVVWIKQAEIGPGNIGEFPKHAQKLKEDIAVILQILTDKFPNLRVAYLSSRIYAGYATTKLNPEPYAYESAFAVRWLIQDQIAGKGIKSPILLWGPYLWANGDKPRKDDKLVWKREDLSDKDGTHPSDSGRQKVAELLLAFFKKQPWFAAQ